MEMQQFLYSASDASPKSQVIVIKKNKKKPFFYLLNCNKEAQSG